MSVDHRALQNICVQLIKALGENPARPGLLDTPRRFADAWKEFVEYNPGRLSTAFDSIATDQVIVLSDIEVWSMCEHHFLPFTAKVAVGLLPKKKLLGLSKYVRIAQAAAHKFTLQERLVKDIADMVELYGQTKDVAVIATGFHLCMACRGVRSNAKATSSIMRGIFRKDVSARAEFISILGLTK